MDIHDCRTQFGDLYSTNEERIETCLSENYALDTFIEKKTVEISWLKIEFPWDKLQLNIGDSSILVF